MALCFRLLRHGILDRDLKIRASTICVANCLHSSKVSDAFNLCYPHSPAVRVDGGLGRDNTQLSSCRSCDEMSKTEKFSGL